VLLIIDKLLDGAQLQSFAQQLKTADWVDGRATAGTWSATVKNNQQLAGESPVAVALGNQLVRVLGSHPLYLSAALPQTIHPPRFNRYQDGGHYGTHVDSAIMRIERNGQLLRSDLSATVFLSEPEEYEGGELVIETEFGAQQVKLPAGSMVLYPSSSLHQVRPVTKGVRTCAILWLQSVVRDASARALLFELDQSLQRLSADLSADDPRLLSLSGIYHNLLRRWSSP
jgi:PKHD-type hydroxylase